MWAWASSGFSRMAGVLELAADLGLLDEATDHAGVVAVVLAQDFQRDVAAQVGVAALEDGAHAAPGDLAVNPVSDRGILRGAAGADDGPGRLAGCGIAEQDAGDRADGTGQRLQDAGRRRFAAGAAGRIAG